MARRRRMRLRRRWRLNPDLGESGRSPGTSVQDRGDLICRRRARPIVQTKAHRGESGAGAADPGRVKPLRRHLAAWPDPLPVSGLSGVAVGTLRWALVAGLLAYTAHSVLGMTA